MAAALRDLLCGCVFFFQAEDGIRDDLVTGVQTCALPISASVTMGLLSRGILRESNPMVTEAEAWLEFARGKTEKAVSKMREAADQDEFGVDEFSLPAREQLGDLLLELKRPADALEAYETMLKTPPGRFDSLWGAGRAPELAEKPEIAARYYAQLLKTAAPSSDRVERQQAIAFLDNMRRTGNGLTRD